MARAPPSSSSSSSSSEADDAETDPLARAQFDAASDFFGQLVSSDPSRVPDATKLRCYGLYKQATAGDAPARGSAAAGVPPWWRPWRGAAASKWRAWSAVRGTPAERAMEMYVSEVRRAAPEWDGARAAGAAAAGAGGAGAAGGGGGGGGGGPGGAVFSRPRAPEDDEEQDDDDGGGGSAEGRPTLLHELAGKGDEDAIVAHLDAVARRAAAEAAGGAAGGDGTASADAVTAASALSARPDDPPPLRAAAAAVRAAVDARDADGATPLHFAADRGRAGAARLLVRGYGARADARDADGASALHYAAAGGHAGCCEALVRECGADAGARDSDGATARDLGAEEWAFWPEEAAS